MLIGLTGGIASGKTTIADWLKGEGVAVIDTDVIAREVVEPGLPAWKEIVREFGEEYLFPDGHLDRKKIAERVFTEPESLKTLNRITHPRVAEKLAEKLKRVNPLTIIVVVVPLLFEAGMEGMFHEIWAAVCTEEEQVERLMSRENLSEKEAQKRIRVQMPVLEKAKRSTRVINTSLSPEETKKQVCRYLSEAKLKVTILKNVK